MTESNIILFLGILVIVLRFIRFIMRLAKLDDLPQEETDLTQQKPSVLVIPPSLHDKYNEYKTKA
jgi:hypothetical protein